MANTTAEINRAVVYSEPGISLQTELVENPIPQPGHGEILLRLSHSGVCHTDIGFCLNLFDIVPEPTPKNQIGGHEGVGVVVLHGPNVSSPAIGSRVGISYAADACLACSRCIEGAESSCEASKVSGYFTPGTFQQYCIASARYVIPLPEKLKSSIAAPLMCGGLSVYTALKTAGIRPGNWVAVCGAGGGLGHLGIQYAQAMSGRVVALDSGSKKDFCLSLGAEAFLDFTQFKTPSDMANEIHRITGGGARIVLMCTSSSRAYSQAMSWLSFRGTLACLGIPDKEGLLVPSVIDMVTNELRIIATKTGNRLEARECLDIAVRGGIKVHHQLRRMDELTKVMEELESGEIQGRVVIDLR